MDFVLNEVIEEDNEFKLVFSDDKWGRVFWRKTRIEFYRWWWRRSARGRIILQKCRQQWQKFSNQTRNPDDAVNESEDEYYGEDNMPELFNPKNREDVEFDSFDNYSDKSQIFKDSLLRFADVDNQFF